MKRLLKRLLAVLAWMLALCAVAEAHEVTFSQVDVRLEQGETLLGVQLPIKALLQEQPTPLPAGTTEASITSSSGRITSCSCWRWFCWGGGLWSQVKIITAFTVAHGIALALATLDVQPPSQLVESVIALSMVVVGLHDLRQLRRGRAEFAGRDPRTLFVFAFGLVHGFGFASVLAALDLPRLALAWSFAAFNFGVEIGQVIIVLMAAPLIAALNVHACPTAIDAGSIDRRGMRSGSGGQLLALAAGLQRISDLIRSAPAGVAGL
jgi:HupE/UreJ protein